MNPILRETGIITFWTFFTSVIIGAAGSLALRWPLTATYLMSVLTIGPVLAILRGRDRAKDPLDIGERAGVELLSLAILIGIGWVAGQYLGK
ncbi:MAG TPA: hypothetical protein VD969_15845 [Symbiobacteriaceae bacterium]|nr:hypothetical protein [Symbiobacteriaceae bacterium]